jgi:hypothetical protein
MKYTYYKLNISEDVNLINLQIESCPPVIQNSLYKFENELINKILEEQSGKIGVYKLGNYIRFQMSDYFVKYESNISLIKATENKRSLHKLLIEWIEKSYNSEVYLFVYEKEFGRKIVDNSAITISSIIETLQEVYLYFNIKRYTSFYVIEMNEFTDYRFEKVNDTYTSKKYYKLFKNVK